MQDQPVSKGQIVGSKFEGAIIKFTSTNVSLFVFGPLALICIYMITLGMVVFIFTISDLKVRGAKIATEGNLMNFRMPKMA